MVCILSLYFTLIIMFIHLYILLLLLCLYIILFWHGWIFVILKKKEVLAYESSVTRLCVRYEFNLENFFAYKFSVGLFDSTILAKTKKNRDIKEDGKGSLIWRKLLKLRPLYQFIRFEVNDGQAAFF